MPPIRSHCAHSCPPINGAGSSPHFRPLNRKRLQKPLNRLGFRIVRPGFTGLNAFHAQPRRTSGVSPQFVGPRRIWIKIHRRAQPREKRWGRREFGNQDDGPLNAQGN